MYNCRVFYLSDALLMMSTFCKIFERLFFGEIFFMICSNLKEICIFQSWKNTAHPQIIGALGHRTDCIVKQPKNATITIYLYSYSPALCCHKRNSGLSCRSYMYKQSSTHALENLNFVQHSTVMVCAEDLFCISL